MCISFNQTYALSFIKIAGLSHVYIDAYICTYLYSYIHIMGCINPYICKVFLDSVVTIRVNTSCVITLTTAQNSHLLKEKEVKFKYRAGWNNLSVNR